MTQVRLAPLLAAVLLAGCPGDPPTSSAPAAPSSGQGAPGSDQSTEALLLELRTRLEPDVGYAAEEHLMDAVERDRVAMLLAQRPQDLTALRAALRESDDPRVRAGVALALRELGPAAEPAVPELTAALLDEWVDVLRFAAEALARIGAPESLDALDDARLRKSGAEAEIMSAMQTVAAAPAPEGRPPRWTLRKTVTQLRAELGHADPTVVAAAERGLHEYLRCENREVQRQVQAAVIFAPGGTALALELLKKDLREGEPRWRRAAAQALGFIGGEAARPDLIEALRQPDSGVRAKAAFSLFEVGVSPEATQALVAVLDDPSSIARNHAARALGELEPSSAEARVAVAALMQLVRKNLGKGHDGPSGMAVQSLGKLAAADPEAIVSFLGELVGADEHRRGAVYSLQQLGREGARPAAPALTRLLVATSSAATVASAIELLRMISPDDPSILPALEELIRQGEAGEGPLAGAEERAAAKGYAATFGR